MERATVVFFRYYLSNLSEKVYHAMKHCRSPSIIAKYKYLNNLFCSRTRTDTKQMIVALIYRTVNNCGGGLILLTGIVTLCLNPLQKESLIVDDDAKATAFNEYFQSMFTKGRLSDLSSSLVNQSPVIDSISFTPNNVYQELVNLDCCKACGPDLIPPFVKEGCCLYLHVFHCPNYLISQC